jgi:exosortase B
MPIDSPIKSNGGITASKTFGLLPLFLGMLALYGPTLFDLGKEVWHDEGQAHVPIILIVVMWLLYQRWPKIRNIARHDRPSSLGYVLLTFALILYVIGRSQEVMIFELGSLILVFVAITLAVLGPQSLRAQIFPIFFLIFIIPLPGTVVDALTLPMKIGVSIVVDNVLHLAGYPIARNGVMLQIGSYKLLVADACAGLHTLFTLEAIGLLYLNLVRHPSAFRNIALAIMIVPISFCANVIRVIVLTLITFYFGDAAGQGFLHGFAGIVLFVSALMLIILADSMLRVSKHFPNGM